jgi:hypothetical protein
MDFGRGFLQHEWAFLPEREGGLYSNTRRLLPCACVRGCRGKRGYGGGWPKLAGIAEIGGHGWREIHSGGRDLGRGGDKKVPTRS